MPVKRVLHIGPLPPPLGGVASALERILQCEALQGYSHLVFNTSAGHVTEVVGDKSITPSRVLRRLSLTVRLARFARRVHPDLVHFQFASDGLGDEAADFMLLHAATFARCPILVHLHLNPKASALPGERPWSQALFRALMGRSAAFFTLTEDYRRDLIRGGTRQPVYVVPNMVDEPLLDLALARAHPDETVRVVFLGRLTRAKGVFDLLQVAAGFRHKHPNVLFQLAGLPSTPAEAQCIRELVARDRLEANVQQLGLVTGAEKRRLYEHADIVVIPSYSETLSIVALEAMAAGLPVLAARTAGPKQLVLENETGYLFEAGDLQTFAAKLTELVQNPARRQQMGCLGRERFRAHFSSERTGETIAGAYAHLMS